MHVGSTCGRINDEYAQCFEGYCPDYDGNTYLCQPFKQLGEPCGGYSGDDPCGARGFGNGAYCSDWSSGTCVASCSR